jgi:Arc/MetJ-type ribon-helix-helix transcriptional regulator
MDQDTDIDRLLGHDAAEEIRAAVASGEYETPEAAIREAVDGWCLARFERQPWVREALEQGLRSLDEGRFVEADDAFWENIAERARAKPSR